MPVQSRQFENVCLQIVLLRAAAAEYWEGAGKITERVQSSRKHWVKTENIFFSWNWFSNLIIFFETEAKTTFLWLLSGRTFISSGLVFFYKVSLQWVSVWFNVIVFG